MRENSGLAVAQVNNNKRSPRIFAIQHLPAGAHVRYAPVVASVCVRCRPLIGCAGIGLESCFSRVLQSALPKVAPGAGLDATG